jgi:thiamine pyrophosphokinase
VREGVVVVANGAPGRIGDLPAWARAADFAIAADGGYELARRLGFKVDLVVGDSDSLSEEARREIEEKGIEVEVHPREKDASDLELALDRALALRPKQLALIGAIGDRLDHSLAGIFLLEKAAAAGVEAVLLHGRERAYLVRDRLEIEEARVGDLVSLLPLSQEARGVRTEGLRYPLCGETLHRAGSRGISNVVLVLPARVALAEGSLLVVHHASPSVSVSF